MTTSSSSATFFGDQNQMHSSAPTSSSLAPPKKKRNQPGTPNPDAEVIALSPKTLMATNRFICEVCNKGFQREQNLQLHRRGHNLPWKLKQKTTKEVKRKVYLCPEPTCVHHDPSRALGDLTGIKKHFFRKHGEKKWKCEKCSKRYAVQSDWKAHSKTCGTKEYRCDCGTLFSRRDSFITHRAFCDALAQESARHPTTQNVISSHLYGGGISNTPGGLGLSQLGSQISPTHDQNNQSGHHDILRLAGGARPGQFDHLLPPSIGSAFRPQHTNMPSSAFFSTLEPNQDYTFHGLMDLPGQVLDNNKNNPPAAANHFNLGFFANSSNANNNNNNQLPSPSLFSNQFNNENGSGGGGSEGSNIFSGNIMGNQLSSGHGHGHVPSLYSSSFQNNNATTTATAPNMSATALLQKAAQIGSTSSNNNNGNNASLLRTLGSSSPKPNRPMAAADHFGSIFGQNENNFQDLMNSLTGSTGGNSSIFGRGLAAAGGGGGNSYGLHQNSTGFGKMGDPKLKQSFTGNIGGSDGLTRDFLGVGQIVRSMNGGGGFSQQQQQQQHHGMDASSLDSDTNTAPTSQSFGGGSFGGD